MPTMSFWMSSSLLLSAGDSPALPSGCRACHKTLIGKALAGDERLSFQSVARTRAVELAVGVDCRFGNTVLVHFEDMAHQNLDRLLSQYRGSLACFSDDVQVRSDHSDLLLMPCMLTSGALAIVSGAF